MKNRNRVLLIISIIIFILFLLFLTNGNTADVTLAWDANTEEDLKGYKIYVGKVSRHDPSLDAEAITNDAAVKACGSNLICIRSWKDYCRCEVFDWQDVYTDKDTKFTSLPSFYRAIPPLTMIRTPNADRNIDIPSGYLTFDINEAGMIYIAYDEKITTEPEWFTSGAIDYVYMGDSNKICTEDTCYKVYSGNAGSDSIMKINFGGNNTSEDTFNYFVLTKLTVSNIGSKFIIGTVDYTCIEAMPENVDLLCDNDYHSYDDPFYDVQMAIEYKLTGLTIGETYFLAATAYNTKNIESKFSVELVHTAGTTVIEYVKPSTSNKQPMTFRNIMLPH